MLEANPVLEAELECINVAIRKERARLWDYDIEDSYYLNYLESEKERGVEAVVTNF